MYAIYYMMVSFVSLDTKLPWQTCDEDWSSDLCRQEPYPKFDTMTNMTEMKYEALRLKNKPCLNTLLVNLSAATGIAYTDYEQLPSDLLAFNTSSCDLKLKTPSEEFWTRYVLRLHEADGFSDMGGLSLKLAICLLLASFSSVL